MKSPIEVYLTFDLETTGLSPEKNAIVEIACCAMDKELNDISEFSSKIIKPYDSREISPQALEANGISMSQLENGVDSKEAFKELISYLKSFKKTPAKIILCGHNIDKFDIPFLENFFRFHKKELNKFVSDKITIDTMWWARIKWIESENYTLGTSCKNSGITLTNAHRALVDAQANKKLVKYFIESLREANSKSAEIGGKRIRPKFEF